MGSEDLRSHHVTGLASKGPRSKLSQTTGSVTQPPGPRTKSSLVLSDILSFPVLPSKMRGFAGVPRAVRLNRQLHL